MGLSMNSTEERKSAHADEEVVLLSKAEALINNVKISIPQAPVELHEVSVLRDKTNMLTKKSIICKNNGEYHDNHL